MKRAFVLGYLCVLSAACSPADTENDLAFDAVSQDVLEHAIDEALEGQAMPEMPVVPEAGIVVPQVATTAVSTARCDVVVSIDSSRGVLTATANGTTVFSKAATRFGVIEWGYQGRESGRVGAVVITSEPPVYATNQAVFSGVGSAKGAPWPLYAWRETWDVGPRDCTVSLVISNMAPTGATLKIHATGKTMFPWPKPPLAESRFLDRICHDFGEVCILTSGFFDFYFRGGRTVQGLTLHGGYSLRSGEVRRQTATFRFVPGTKADPNFKPESFLQPLYDAIAKSHPAVLHWPDRRPIYASFAALTARGFRLGYSTNPRGYVAADDVTTPEGMARFRARKVQEAWGLVEACRKVNAQGVIIWDLEGQECRHAITYCGSPDRLLLQAPEMDEVADDFFAVFFEAGVRAGICVRPQSLHLRGGRHPDMDPSNQFDGRKGGTPKYAQDRTYASAGGAFDAKAVTQMLAGKIGYAYRRWKVTLFYVDSPVNVTDDVFTELARQFPDCLIIPEYPVITWYGATAPLFVPPVHVRRIWPEAFGCVCMRGFAGAKSTEVDIQEALKQGCIALGTGFRGVAPVAPEWSDPSRMTWRDDQPVNQALNRTLLEQARRKGGP